MVEPEDELVTVEEDVEGVEVGADSDTAWDGLFSESEACSCDGNDETANPSKQDTRKTIAFLPADCLVKTQ
jgi:hypothetical protein